MTIGRPLPTGLAGVAPMAEAHNEATLVAIKVRRWTGGSIIGINPTASLEFLAQTDRLDESPLKLTIIRHSDQI